MDERIPKEQWAPGPWHDEPDRLEWRTPNGMPALIVRGPMGALCGYAGVPPGHPLYGLRYSDCAFHFKAADCKGIPWRRHLRGMRAAKRYLWLRYGKLEKPTGLSQLLARETPRRHTECDGHAPDDLFSVHGGLTFAGGCHGNICHTPKAGEPDKVWWYGFDTAHAGDLPPGLVATLKEIGSVFSAGLHDGDVYRDLNYVQGQVSDLASQLECFRGRIYCQRCKRRRRLSQLQCRCGSKGAWRFN